MTEYYKVVKSAEVLESYLGVNSRYSIDYATLGRLFKVSMFPVSLSIK